jgi:hypothetical protein
MNIKRAIVLVFAVRVASWSAACTHHNGNGAHCDFEPALGGCGNDYCDDGLVCSVDGVCVSSAPSAPPSSCSESASSSSQCGDCQLTFICPDVDSPLPLGAGAVCPSVFIDDAGAYNVCCDMTSIGESCDASDGGGDQQDADAADGEADDDASDASDE